LVEFITNNATVVAKESNGLGEKGRSLPEPKGETKETHFELVGDYYPRVIQNECEATESCRTVYGGRKTEKKKQ